jgi:hypothetical protein
MFGGKQKFVRQRQRLGLTNDKIGLISEEAAG